MFAKRWRHLVVGLGSVAAFLVPSGSHPSAHDLERTEVTLTFNSNTTFVLDVANDPDWLVQRLEPFAIEAGIPVAPLRATNGVVSTADRDARLKSFAPAFIDRVVLWIDGREVRPESAEFVAPRERTPADDLSPPAIYRLRGRVPTDVRTLRWFYGLVIDDYPMTVRRADGRALTETIFGRAWSGSLDLGGQFINPPRLEIARRFMVDGLSHAVRQGVEHLLFVFALVVFSIGFRAAFWQLGVFLIAQTIGVFVMTLPARVVEPIVILSIAYVVVEGMLSKRVTPWRLALIGVFGVVHGADLAGAVNSLTAPPSAFRLAVWSFAFGAIAAELAGALVGSAFKRTV